MFKPSGKLGGSENAPIDGSRLSRDGALAGGLSPSHQQKKKSLHSKALRGLVHLKSQKLTHLLPQTYPRGT
jgi:hypothetical protein